jgi:hypothetical protein
MKTTMNILSVVFLAAAVLSLGAGVLNYRHKQAVFATAEEATATLTEFVPDPNPKVPDFCPVYEYTTQAGMTVSFVDDSCPSQPDYSQIGSTQTVYFDPKQPQIVETKGWTGTEGSGLIFGAIGFAFFLVMALAMQIVNFAVKRTPGLRSATGEIGSRRDDRRQIEEQSVAQLTADVEAQRARLDQMREELRQKMEERRRRGT